MRRQRRMPAPRCRLQGPAVGAAERDVWGGPAPLRRHGPGLCLGAAGRQRQRRLPQSGRHVQGAPAGGTRPGAAGGRRRGLAGPVRQSASGPRFPPSPEPPCPAPCALPAPALPLPCSTPLQHFIGNDLEDWRGVTRYNFNATIDARDLRDSFLPPFEGCVRARAHSLMCSYNAGLAGACRHAGRQAGWLAGWNGPVAASLAGWLLRQLLLCLPAFRSALAADLPPCRPPGCSQRPAGLRQPLAAE